jgi:branched-chain amino acid transport system ATP-binding protein
MPDTQLALHRLCKSFAGIQVTDNVTLEISKGELHGLIGPNGAGKTTLISQIAGQLAPDIGKIEFDGRDITNMTVAERSRCGLGRTYQISRFFKSQRVIDNVVMAIRASQMHCFNFWWPSRQDSALYDEARDILYSVGLAERALEGASELAYGEYRQLELAMALATRPTLLLLDEPMAGLGAGESIAMADHLESLRGRYTMLLIEHDMDAVFRLADCISVLVRGAIVASGNSDEIRNNPKVQEAYLGNPEDFDLSIMPERHQEVNQDA